MGEFLFFDTADLRDEEIALSLKRTAEEDPVRQLVPAYYFDILHAKTGERMGECDLRVGSGYNIYYAGNIGYRVFKRFQGHHYAGYACRLLFRLAQRHGMEEVLVTCKTDNIASARICEWAGMAHLGIILLPEDNPMYAQGYREIHRFVWRIRR